MASASNASPPLDAVVAAMLALLDGYRPTPISGLPQPGIALVSVAERAVGIGNRTGTEFRGSLVVAELKGVRLEAVVRFQLWGADPGEAENAATELHGRLLKDRDVLRSAGVLRLALESAASADYVAAVNGWRKDADFRLLYEFPYQDADGAESLIARIPIDIDPEERDSLHRETSTVTDELTRWDDVDAPMLRVRGRHRIGRISALAFVPGTPPGGTVTVARTFDGAVGPPNPQGSLTAFLDAVAGSEPPDRHASVTFPSLGVFLDALGPGGAPVTLGDWNEDTTLDDYVSRSLVLDPPIDLPTVTDRLEVTYESAAFNEVAVVYLQATRT